VHNRTPRGSSCRRKGKKERGEKSGCREKCNNPTVRKKSVRVRAGPLCPQYSFPQSLVPPDVTDARYKSPPNGPQTQVGKGLSACPCCKVPIPVQRSLSQQNHRLTTNRQLGKRRLNRGRSIQPPNPPPRQPTRTHTPVKIPHRTHRTQQLSNQWQK